MKCKSQAGFGPKGHFITNSQTRESQGKGLLCIASLSDKMANIPKRHKFRGGGGKFSPISAEVVLLGTSRAGCFLKDLLLLKWHLSLRFRFVFFLMQCLF